MCERDVSSAYPSGAASSTASPVAAPFAYLSATSLPVAALRAGTHRMVTSLDFASMREQTSIAATVKRCMGPMAPSITRSMVGGKADEHRVPVSAHPSPAEGAEGLVGNDGLHVKNLLLMPRLKWVLSTPPGCSRHMPLLSFRHPVGSRRFRLYPGRSISSRFGGRRPFLVDDIAGEATCRAPLWHLCNSTPDDVSGTP